MDAQTEQQSGDARAVLAKIKEPIEIGHESITIGQEAGGEDGSYNLGADFYSVEHEDGSVEPFQIVTIGKESFIVRTKEETMLAKDGGKKVIVSDYDSEHKAYVPRDPKASDFEALLRGVATTREKGGLMLWDGKTPDGKATGGVGLFIKKYDAPVARPHLIALLNREKLIPPTKYL